MLLGISDTHKKIATASKLGWKEFASKLKAEANNDLVDAVWSVEYDELGHDIIMQAKVAVKDKNNFLLQVWLKDLHPGIWIPELRPWVSAVVEFDPSQKTQKALLGLIDSKWRKEDAGVEFRAVLWGYVQHGAAVANFWFEKKFTYPGKKKPLKK